MVSLNPKLNCRLALLSMLIFPGWQNILLVTSGFTRPHTPLEAVDVVDRVTEHLRDEGLSCFAAILVAADDEHAVDVLFALDVVDHPGIVILYDITTLVKSQRARSIAELAVGKSIASSEFGHGEPFQLENE